MAFELPAVLAPYEAAITVASAGPRPDGWHAGRLADAPTVPLVPGAPPYDGVYRGSFTDPVRVLPP